MCDYSLMGVPNRLAREGEMLVGYRFSTGSYGLASLREVAERKGCEIAKTLLRRVKLWFSPLSKDPAACCLPPGAKLRLIKISVRNQERWNVGPTEEVVFTQLTAEANRHRDAIVFSNGRTVRIQDFEEGQRVEVLDLTSAEEFVEFHEEALPFAMARR
jgi:hypothetical protein